MGILHQSSADADEIGLAVLQQFLRGLDVGDAPCQDHWDGDGLLDGLGNLPKIALFWSALWPAVAAESSGDVQQGDSGPLKLLGRLYAVLDGGASLHVIASPQPQGDGVVLANLGPYRLDNLQMQPDTP